MLLAVGDMHDRIKDYHAAKSAGERLCKHFVTALACEHYPHKQAACKHYEHAQPEPDRERCTAECEIELGLFDIAVPAHSERNKYSCRSGKICEYRALKANLGIVERYNRCERQHKQRHIYPACIIARVEQHKA